MKKQSLQLCALMLIALTTLSLKSYSQYWKLKGNAGTNPAINFLGTTDKQPLIFRTSGDERMRILSSGKVGIGIKTPDAKLHVVGKDNVSLSTPGYLMLGKVESYNMALDVNVIQARYNGTASSLYLNYYGGYTYLGPSAAVTINSSGNLTTSYPVGIRGTYNSSYALNVNASSAYSGINVTDPIDNYVLLSNKSGLNAGLQVNKSSTSSGTPSVGGYNSGSGGGIEGTSGTGIGVYGSSSSYHGVYGYTGGTQAAGDYAGYFAGAVFATGGYYSSDQNLKKDIKDFGSAMSIISKLKPKTYEFRNDGDYKLMGLPVGEHYGLIAQDVEKVLPDLVRNSRFDTRYAKNGPSSEADAKNNKTIMFKALNYNELIPILIKGMQEQQAVIDRQQQQIDELKQMVQSMVASNSSDAKAAGTATGAYLVQNAPNPFSDNTTVKCYVPSSVKQAQLAVYNMDGKIVKSYMLTSGTNNVNIIAGSLASGQYTYSLLVDGKKVDSKSMIMTK